MNSTTLSLPAPAKLNLFLHITGRRANGYHELQTLFQFLDYGDTLHFSLRDDGQLNLLTELAGVDAEDNLIIRAARLLREASGCQLGADIRLDKILPMGGGIGGGSSDAATTLLGLNQLWQTGLSLEQLAPGLVAFTGERNSAHMLNPSLEVALFRRILFGRHR